MTETSVRRTHHKLIRYTAEESELVASRARSAGRPTACFIRESSLGSSPRIRRTELSDSLIRVLANAASRLTHLAAVARKQELPGASEFEVAVSEVLDVIRQLD